MAHFCQESTSNVLVFAISLLDLQVSLVVNVASKCGYTDRNYRELVRLQQTFEPHGFTILAFPCNQFLEQEPGSNEEILTFADAYQATFPLFSKSDVKGENAHEVYQFLAEETGSEPLWNFNKYLIDGDGRVVQYFSHLDTFNDIKHSVQYLLSKRSEL